MPIIIKKKKPLLWITLFKWHFTLVYFSSSYTSRNGIVGFGHLSSWLLWEVVLLKEKLHLGAMCPETPPAPGHACSSIGIRPTRSAQPWEDVIFLWQPKPGSAGWQGADCVQRAGRVRGLGCPGKVVIEPFLKAKAELFSHVKLIASRYWLKWRLS